MLIRTDGAGCTHTLLTWLTAHHRNLGYSLGFPLSVKHVDAFGRIPPRAWTPAYDADGQVRPGAWVTDATASSTPPVGRRACASSSARSARTRVRSSRSPTSTDTG